MEVKEISCYRQQVKTQETQLPAALATRAKGEGVFKLLRYYITDSRSCRFESWFSL